MMPKAEAPEAPTLPPLTTAQEDIQTFAQKKLDAARLITGIKALTHGYDIGIVISALAVASAHIADAAGTPRAVLAQTIMDVPAERIMELARQAFIKEATAAAAELVPAEKKAHPRKRRRRR